MELPPQPYGGVFEILVRLQDECIVLKNIAFGDVFLCAGQSNMQFSIAEENGAMEIKDDTHIRFAPTYASLEEIKIATEIWCEVIKNEIK